MLEFLSGVLSKAMAASAFLCISSFKIISGGFLVFLFSLSGSQWHLGGKEKFRVVGKFFCLKIISPKTQNLWLKPSILDKFRDIIRILSTCNLLC